MPTRPTTESLSYANPDSDYYRALVAAEAAERATATRAGNALKAARASAGLTQEQLATTSGVTREDISAMERGLLNPTVKRLARLADAMGLVVDFALIPADAMTSRTDVPSATAPARKPGVRQRANTRKKPAQGGTVKQQLAV